MEGDVAPKSVRPEGSEKVVVISKEDEDERTATAVTITSSGFQAQVMVDKHDIAWIRKADSDAWVHLSASDEQDMLAHLESAEESGSLVVHSQEEVNDGDGTMEILKAQIRLPDP